jgi:hypothetical protein
MKRRETMKDYVRLGMGGKREGRNENKVRERGAIKNTFPRIRQSESRVVKGEETREKGSEHGAVNKPLGPPQFRYGRTAERQVR